MDLYLKFESEDAATAVLYTQEPSEWDNSDPENPVATAWEPRANYANIDTIGVIYQPTGEMLQGEDGEYPEMAPIEGFYVNIRLMPDEFADTLDPFVVYPKTPVRIWG
jgi:hypothetical protein